MVEYWEPALVGNWVDQKVFSKDFAKAVLLAQSVVDGLADFLVPLKAER